MTQRPKYSRRPKCQTCESTSADEAPGDNSEQDLSSEERGLDEAENEMFKKDTAGTEASVVGTGPTDAVEEDVLPDDLEHDEVTIDAFKRIMAEVPSTGFMVSRDADWGRSSSQFEEQIQSMLAKTSASPQYCRMKEAMAAHFPHATSSAIFFVGVEAHADIADIAAHLSVLFARNDDFRVLLIDADFPQKTLSARFGFHGAKGLAEILVEEVSSADVIRACNTNGLNFMPAGAGLFPHQPSAIRRLPGIIDQLKRSFSLVCVDAGGADQSCARSLARWCDAVYFVLPMGTHAPDEVTGAVDCLRAHGARLLGSVLSRIPIDVAPATNSA